MRLAFQFFYIQKCSDIKNMGRLMSKIGIFYKIKSDHHFIFKSYLEMQSLLKICGLYNSSYIQNGI